MGVTIPLTTPFMAGDDAPLLLSREAILAH